MEMTFKLRNAERMSNFVENDNRTKRWTRACSSERRNQIFHTNTEHKYSSYGDQITSKVSRSDLEIVGFIVYISKSFPVYFKYGMKCKTSARYKVIASQIVNYVLHCKQSVVE